MNRPNTRYDTPAERVEISGDAARSTSPLYRCGKGHEFTVDTGGWS